MGLSALLLCASLLHGLACGCDVEMFVKAVKGFQILAPGGSHCMKSYVGEALNLECTSVCGGIYWFVNDTRVVIGEDVDNATVTMSSSCVNENNTCSFENYIDCNTRYEDGRFLLSTLTIIPTAESHFLIECEAELCEEEFRKSVTLAAKEKLATSKPIPSSSTSPSTASIPSSSTSPLARSIPSSSTSPSTASIPSSSTSPSARSIPSSSTSPPTASIPSSSTSPSAACPSIVAAADTPSPNNVDIGNSDSALAVTPTPESCESNTAWILAFICGAQSLALISLLLVLTIFMYRYTSRTK